MPIDVEFDFDGAEPADESGDTISSGRDVRTVSPRPTRLLWSAAGGVVVLVLALAVARGHSHPAAKPVVAKPAALDLQAQLTTIALSPDPMGVILDAKVFGCPKVSESYPPTPSQLKSIMSVFPAFYEVESGPTIDGSSGLCSIDFRAIDGQGDTLIVAVSAPPHPAAPLRVDVNTDHGHDFVGAEYTSDDGFHVQVGVFDETGQSGATLDQVNQLTQDAALTW